MKSAGENSSDVAPARRQWLLRLLPLLVLLGIGVLVYLMGWHRLLTLEHLVQHRDRIQSFIDRHFLASILLYLGIYTSVAALSIPGAVYLTLIGGFLFGWLAGGLATIIAATAGAIVVFLIARTALGQPMAERAGPRIDKLRRGFQENALSYLLFLRLVPLFPFWFVNLAAGLLGVPLRTFIIATLIGIIPGTFAFTFIGVGLDSVIASQEYAFQSCLRFSQVQGRDCKLAFDPHAFFTPQVLIAFAALGVIALLPVVVKKVLGVRVGEDADPKRRN